MPLELLHDGNVLPLEPGMPENYQGYILHGGDAFHAHSNAVTITLQQIEVPLGLQRIIHARYKKPAKLLCRYYYNEHVLTLRHAIEGEAVELIKGGGRQDYHDKQFTILFSNNYQSVMFAEETGEHTFMDLVYKKELLGSGFKKNPEIQNGFENSYTHIPHRFTGQRLFLSLPMHTMLTGMRSYRNATIPLENYLMAEMPKYLSCALGEIGNFDTTRYGIKYKYWEACTRIKEYIANNLDNDFTIRSLVRIAQINGTSIKQEFRRITGFTVESYRLYLKLKRSFKELAIPDAQIKFMNDIAGYEGASTFTRGFKRRLLCLPSEFNTDEWDITNIEKIVRSAH